MCDHIEEAKKEIRELVSDLDELIDDMQKTHNRHVIVIKWLAIFCIVLCLFPLYMALT